MPARSSSTSPTPLASTSAELVVASVTRPVSPAPRGTAVVGRACRRGRPRWRAVARVSVLRTRLRAEAPPAAAPVVRRAVRGWRPGSRAVVGEPCGKGFLVVAGVKARRVTRVGDFDRGRDERAQRRVDVEGGEEAFAGVRSVLSNTSGRMSGSNRRRHSAISSSLR